MGQIVLLALLVVVGAFGTWIVLGYLKGRGARLVTCPETRTAQAVTIDAGHAAATQLMGHADLRLASCSRWPERQSCGQECLAQITAAPDGCLIRSLVANWYEGKACALCQRPVGVREWMEHEPALVDLRDPVRRTIAWREVSPASMLETLATHAPVCWNCHVTETFRREHADLVIERPSFDGTTAPDPRR